VAILMLATYGLFLVGLFWTRHNSFSLALAGFGSLFLEFKHSFVRPPGHSEIVFTLLPLLLAMVLLFTVLTRGLKWPVPAAILILLAVWYSQESGRVSAAHLVYSQFGLRSAKTAQRALNYPALRRTLSTRPPEQTSP
jgi:hypothetical protein